MFNVKYLQIDCIPNTLSPRPIPRIPHRTFFPRLRVSHYPQFIKAANSGVVTACVLLKVQFVTACVLLKVQLVFSLKYNLLQLVSSLKYNLQTWAWTWSTVPESDESGGKVGSCLHCLQIKSSDGSINPQTVRHIVEKSFFARF